MISDVLFDAVDAIRQYQQRMPQVYGDMEKPINLVTAAMEWLQAELDRLKVDAEADYDTDVEELTDDHADDHRPL